MTTKLEMNEKKKRKQKCPFNAVKNYQKAQGKMSEKDTIIIIAVFIVYHHVEQFDFA